MSEQAAKRPRTPYVSDDPKRDWERFKQGVKTLLTAEPKKVKLTRTTEVLPKANPREIIRASSTRIIDLQTSVRI